MSSTLLHGLTKIVILNPKGGCGKTTLATNLASAYALRGAAPTLLDFDPHGFSMRWLEHRPAERPEIVGIAACGRPADCAWALQDESPCRVILIDLPAAIAPDTLETFTWIADRIVIPVMPSEIDVHSATRLIERLLLDARLDRRARKLAVVASRVRSNTKSFQMLMRFLTSLKIPLIGVIRDSQNFVQAAAQGIGVCELPAHRARDDMAQMNAIADWLERELPSAHAAISAPDRAAEHLTVIAEGMSDLDGRSESAMPAAWPDGSY